jgi:hypothetical protein
VIIRAVTGRLVAEFIVSIKRLHTQLEASRLGKVV